MPYYIVSQPTSNDSPANPHPLLDFSGLGSGLFLLLLSLLIPACFVFIKKISQAIQVGECFSEKIDDMINTINTETTEIKTAITNLDNTAKELASDIKNLDSRICVQEDKLPLLKDKLEIELHNTELKIRKDLTRLDIFVSEVDSRVYQVENYLAIKGDYKIRDFKNNQDIKRSERVKKLDWDSMGEQPKG
jgi:Skp family chaperone for outer membrane proteins